MGAYWAIQDKRIDAARFFGELPRHFPDATTLYVECSSIAPEVETLLASHAEDGPYLPGSQTTFPKSKRFRFRFTGELCAAMETLSERHAKPEMCDHLYLYRGDMLMLEFPDFCGNEIVLPIATPEDTVRAFATAFGLKYWKRDDG